MTEEKEKRTFSGVLMGIIHDNEGEPHIGIDVDGAKVALTIDQAGELFNQLGDLLDTQGYFESENEAENEEVICKMH